MTSMQELPPVESTPEGPVYLFLALAGIAAFFLVLKSKARNKILVFFISFYLLSGNLNNLLTFKIPGVSFFEIQPIRFVFLLLSAFIFWKLSFGRDVPRSLDRVRTPFFIPALLGYVFWVIIATLVNSSEMESSEVINSIYDVIAFLVILYGIRLLKDWQAYLVIGKSIIIGAVISAVVSLIQFVANPMFLRIGDQRPAFGGFLRSNGIFSTEYFNSYFLITAMVWSFILIRNTYLKFSIAAVLILGVISSFQRMSWIIMFVVLATYLIWIVRVRLERLALLVFMGISALLIGSMLYYEDIMKSSLVQERLSDSVDGRAGYYKLVLENIDERPIFGYGDLKNDVYYTNILKITGNRMRATAEAGDLHSGYFSSMFLYGIPGFIFFILFVLLSAMYYARQYRRNLYYAIPLFVSLIYLIGNLTNTFLFLKYIAILYAIHIGIGMGLSREFGLSRLGTLKTKIVR